MPEIGGRKPEKFYPKFEPLAETLTRFVENVKSRTGKPDFETGLEVLDKGIFGLHKAQLTTIAARPGIGKTTLVCQAAVHIAKMRKKVAFLSLEMTKETIIERMFCSEFGVNGFDLIMGRTNPETDHKMNRFVAEIADLPIRIIDDYCYTENELYTLIDHLEFRPDVLILDHIQHIRSEGKQTQWESLTNYLRFLKEVAMRHKMAVVVLSQINRQGEDAPTIANLKGTGAIEEMSDHVLLMHQLKEPTELGNNFKIQIAKNRFGPVGSFELFFSGETYRFYNNRYEAKLAIGR